MLWNILSYIFGLFSGVVIMCLLQINRLKKEENNGESAENNSQK